MSVQSIVESLLENKDINNEVQYYAQLELLLPNYIKGLDNCADSCFNSLLKHLFVRRYCWGEMVDICDETLTYQFEKHDITIDVKTQINSFIEDFFKLIISNVNLTHYLHILTEISSGISNPLARQHLYLQGYKLLEDEYNNNNVYFFDVAKHLFSQGLTDIWSYTRKAASNIFSNHLQYFTVSNIDCFIHLLIDLYRTNPDWKIIEGLISSICVILSSINNIFENNINVTRWNNEMMEADEILGCELPKLLLTCVRHEQLSVREISIKAYILYLNKTRKNINELYYTFLLPQLQPYITDPLSSQGFFDLLRNLVPLLDINELYAKFHLIWDAISVYFSDEASTVRQSISSVVQSLCKVEKTQPKLILLIIQLLVDFYDENSKWQIRDTILLCYEYIFQILLGENLDANQPKITNNRCTPSKLNYLSTPSSIERILKSPIHIQLSHNEMSMIQIIQEDENNKYELLGYLRRIIPQLQRSYSKEEGFEINRIANQISDHFSTCVFYIDPLLLLNEWLNLEEYYANKVYNNTLFILKTFNSVLKNFNTIEDVLFYQTIIHHSKQTPRILLAQFVPKFLETLYELGIKPFSDNIGMLGLKLIFDIYITFEDINIPDKLYLQNKNKYLTGILQKIDKIIQLKKKFYEEPHPDQIKKQAVDRLDIMCREYFLPKLKHIFELVPIEQCHLYFCGLTEWMMLTDKIDDQKEILYVIDQYLNKLIIYSPAYNSDILNNSSVILIHNDNQSSISDSPGLPMFYSETTSKFVHSCLSQENYDEICGNVITNLLTYIQNKTNLSIKKSIIHILVKLNLIGYDLRWFKMILIELSRNINTNINPIYKQNSSSNIHSNSDNVNVLTQPNSELLDNSFDDSENDSWDNGQSNYLREDISWFVKKISLLFQTNTPNDIDKNQYFENIIPLSELWSTKQFIPFSFDNIKSMLEGVTSQKIDDFLT